MPLPLSRAQAPVLLEAGSALYLAPCVVEHAWPQRALLRCRFCLTKDKDST
jgi:hypothetical protein